MASAADSLERYQKLGLKKSLNRIYQYPLACKELSFILRFSYSKFPKNLQSLIFHDTLTAFQILPGMQTQTAVSAANFLLQGAEAALPKQKRAQAVTEFKHAMIAHKRLCKAAQDGEGVAHLPQDVLVHVFSFLDFRSLVSTALVCRSWNAASSDNHLWQLQYSVFFDNSDNHYNSKMLEGGLLVENIKLGAQEAFFAKVGIDWRTRFKRAYRGILSKKFVTSSRGCCKKCSTILWLSDVTNENCEVNCKKHQIEPLSSQQIVEYLNGGSLASPISSDSDSDSDEGSSSKLWAYRRQSSKLHLCNQMYL